jgi:hypothetical protein
MATVAAQERFPVTLMLEDGSEKSGYFDSPDPTGALESAMAAWDRLSGIYSVWDPVDPWGMPLAERTLPL